jgi:putative transposase
MSKLSQDQKQLEREIKNNNNRIDNDTIILTYKIKLKHQIKIRNNDKNKQKWLIFLIKMRQYLKIGKKIINRLIKIKPSERKYITTKNIKNNKIFNNIKRLNKLPSCIICQLIKKYGGNEKLKDISKIILPIHTNPQKFKHKNKKTGKIKIYEHSSIIYNKNNHILKIKPLKLDLIWKCPNPNLIRINLIEINDEYCYVNITAKKIEDNIIYNNVMGYDFNLKPTLVCSSDGKFMGAGILDKRKKYQAMRTRWQKQKRLWKVKQMGNKEQRVMNDINHKLSNSMLKHAKINKAHVSIENLTGIRNQKINKNYKYFLNSWQFYTLRLYLQYKAEYKYGKMQVVAINPAYTSQECSRCGKRNKTTTKQYYCKECKLKEHRDINAAVNISKRGIDRIIEIKIAESLYKRDKIEKKYNQISNIKEKKNKKIYSRKKI